jgi:Ras-related protein Rab-1A
LSKDAFGEFRFKITLCGDWGVGKTSLVRRFADNTFSHDYLATLAVNHTTKVIILDGIKVNLVIWDSGGQERFTKIRRSYYQSSHGVIFVFDLTRPESFRHIEERWLPEVNSVLKDYVPTVWGAKADLVGQRVVSAGSGERVARDANAYYFETSSLTGENVEQAFHSLARQVLSRALTKPTQ